MSYLVGFGAKYPVHVHHRGASIPSIYTIRSPVGCVQGFESWYYRPQPNPNVIYGALVGGPNQNDNFSDDRSDYEESEPTISGSAPLIGLFSRLHDSLSKTKGKVLSSASLTRYSWIYVLIFAHINLTCWEFSHDLITKNHQHPTKHL